MEAFSRAQDQGPVVCLKHSPLLCLPSVSPASTQRYRKLLSLWFKRTRDTGIPKNYSLRKGQSSVLCVWVLKFCCGRRETAAPHRVLPRAQAPSIEAVQGRVSGMQGNSICLGISQNKSFRWGGGFLLRPVGQEDPPAEGMPYVECGHVPLSTRVTQNS